MTPISRRELFGLGLSAAAVSAIGPGAAPDAPDLHRALLDEAARQEARRRAAFEAVKTAADLSALQDRLRATFLTLLDGLPEAQGPPPVRTLGRLEGDGYAVEKLAFESFPGYFVTALLYRPGRPDAPAPGVLSPCGHSADGKAAGPYQTLHINLAKRGYVVLTYDPVGQGERSQFWDRARGRSRFNLACGEHAVLGNPLYLLGTSLARYRVWDGVRALDHLASLPGVDPSRIGCVGNSGGGTLTAYLAALDRRIKAAVIGCYITTLPRRMANRVEADPAADPEQDVFGFVSEGIDHAGLLAMIAPRPTLLATARFDFFPIEGARETFAEAQRLYRAAGAGDRVERVEAEARHGLSLPLREATYAWFDRWLGVREGEQKREPRAAEVAVTPRPADELRVCPDGQVSVSFGSRPLLPIALDEFRKRKGRPRLPLKDLLRRPDTDRAGFRLERVAEGDRDVSTLVLLVNGNEAPDWRSEALAGALARGGFGVAVVDPRGVGSLRTALKVAGHAYEDPLAGVEENLAYNAFLVGTSLLALRVADVRAALAEVSPPEGPGPRRVVLVGRRDAALVACLAAALEPRFDRLAVQEAWLSVLPWFDPEWRPVNAAGVLPGLLRDFGDVADVLAAVAPRPVLAAAPRCPLPRPLPAVRVVDEPFTADPARLLDWLRT
jgi:cephalosporin-C deacetylase-like acetyl esterase